MMRLPIPKDACVSCGKQAVTSFSRSHSHVRTKRLYKPNLVKVGSMKICTRCLRTNAKQTA